MKKSINKISGYFLLALFLAFFASTSFFNHSHIVDGNIIVHSHPYKKDKDGNPVHQHSANDYWLIHIIKNFTTIAGGTLVIAAALLKVIYKISPGRTSSLARHSFKSPYSLRGPPALTY